MLVSSYLTNLKQYNTAKIVNVEFGKIFANGIKLDKDCKTFKFYISSSWFLMKYAFCEPKSKCECPSLENKHIQKKISNKKHILPSLNTVSHLKIRVKCTKKNIQKVNKINKSLHCQIINTSQHQQVG